MAKLTDFTVDFLSNQGLAHGYFIIGGALGFLADACARKNFKLYTTHHEQAAAFAAYGQAATTRGFGLAMATSGPGATNLITGVGSAYFNSLPVVFITGQVNQSESNLTLARRQVGFQETDIVSIIRPITKYAVQVTDASRMQYELEKAFFIAKNGRMGPVLLDIPLDIQKAEIDEGKLLHFIGSQEHAKMLSIAPKPDSAQLSHVAKLISSSSRPILLVGHGARLSNAEGALLQFAQKSQIPVVASLMGTDCIDNSHPLYHGFIGTYGMRHSNFALANSDLIIVIGARLDSRQIGVQAGKFAPGAKIIHVDIDSTELGASVKDEIKVHMDAKGFLEGMLPLVPKHSGRGEWLFYLDFLKKNYPHDVQDVGEGISPLSAISTLSDAASEGDVACVDVGSHQMWFAQSWKVKKGQCVLTDGGMGPMGFSVPAAIGATLSGGKPSWVVVGDGSMQINIQELQTLVRHNVPLKIMVINNNSLGMLTQFQSENFQGRLIGSVDGYSAPDFAKVAAAYGIPSARVQKHSELAQKVAWLASQKGPALLDVIIPTSFWALPKSNFNRPVYDMKPLLPLDELKKALKYVDEKELNYERK